jgi:hypothetical protein
MGEKKTKETEMLSVRVSLDVRSRLDVYRAEQRKKLKRSVPIQEVVNEAFEEFLKKRGA